MIYSLRSACSQKPVIPRTGKTLILSKKMGKACCLIFLLMVLKFLCMSLIIRSYERLMFIQRIIITHSSKDACFLHWPGEMLWRYIKEYNFFLFLIYFYLEQLVQFNKHLLMSLSKINRIWSLLWKSSES